MRVADQGPVIYAFFASAQEGSALQVIFTSSRQDWDDAVRAKWGLPQAAVEIVEESEWNSPSLNTVLPGEVAAKQDAAMSGIREALSQRGINGTDVEVALTRFIATPIPLSGRVVYSVLLPGSRGDTRIGHKASATWTTLAVLSFGLSAVFFGIAFLLPDGVWLSTLTGLGGLFLTVFLLCAVLGKVVARRA